MKKFLAVFLSLALVSTTWAASRSYSGGGGRSFSSGSSGRSSSSSGRSYSGGSSHSYSSGSSGRSYSGSSRSYSGGSSSRSYSGGSSSKSSGSSSSKSYSGGSKSSGSSKSYSGSSSSKSTSSKTYSGGGSSSKSTSTSSSVSSKPNKTSFDSLGAKEQMKVESRQSYQRGQTARTEYKTTSGKTVNIDPKDVRIERLRTQLDQQRWVNRGLRQQQFYGAYYSRPLVVYNDPYPSFFWWWLLDRSLEERAMWAYCHRTDMDQARYQALLAKDAQLSARVQALEAKGVKRDTSYVPNGMEPDLMYSNEYVDAVYNPSTPPQHSWILLRVLMWMAIVALGIFIVWFVFVRRT